MFTPFLVLLPDSTYETLFYKKETKMFKELSHINEDREEGFTLIELLVVIVIIGILSAIAIGAFLNQRQKANDITVKSDIKSVAIAIETAIVDDPNSQVVESTGSNGSITMQFTNSEGETIDPANVTLSEGVSIKVTPTTDHSGTGHFNGYQIAGWHVNGSNYVSETQALTFDSAEGSFLEE